MVRGQIFENFNQLIRLKEINVFNLLTNPPKVLEMENQYSKDMENDILSNDVIIATPQCALSITENKIKKIFRFGIN